MSLCINPKETKIRVKVAGGFVILKVRSASVEETRMYRKAGASPTVKRNQLNWKDESAEAMVDVMDALLIDVSALDNDGFSTELTYTNGTGEDHELNNTVENWKSHISENIKITAGRAFFAVEAEVGEELLKN